jgi:Protein of unknown function (DUF3102)
MGSGSARSRLERQLGFVTLLENSMTHLVLVSNTCADSFASNAAPRCTNAYEGLPGDQVDALLKQAVKIRDRMRSATGRMIEAIVETGRDLTAVKQRLGHGIFCKCVQAECGFTLRTAQNYMKVACTFAEAKCETVSHLQLSTVYELSAKTTPPELVAQVIERGAAGQLVSDGEVRGMLAEAKFQKLNEKRQQKRADTARSLTKRDAQARATALSIIEKLGPEGLQILAPAFKGPDAFGVAEYLRAEIENSIGNANPAQEKT